MRRTAFQGLGVFLTLVLAVQSLAQSTDAEVPELTLSVVEDDETVEEHDRHSSEIRVEASAALPNDIVVEFTVQGTAKRGADYDFPLKVKLLQNTDLGFAFLVPIRDWIKEGTETVRVNLSNVEGDATIGTNSSVSIEILDDFPDDDSDGGNGTITTERKPDLVVFTYFKAERTRVRLAGLLYNYGSEASPPVDVTMKVALNADYSNLHLSTTRRFPGLDELGGWYGEWFDLNVSELNPNTKYYIEFSAEELEEESFHYNNDYTLSFKTDNVRNLLSRCYVGWRPTRTNVIDPYYHEQWHLRNTEQYTWARYNGVEGQDIRMDNVLKSGSPTGDGVTVAIVDSGLEICHPDLVQNIPVTKSFNFIADESSYRYVYGSSSYDPFNVDGEGDHGTSMAGIVGGVRNNGLGGRGVAPDVELRGFNYLKSQSFENLSVSLGLGTIRPRSDEVDIFNMSYGAGLSSTWDVDTLNIFKNGVDNLRGGKGAIYVKAAGNGFNRCNAITHDIHDEIGCLSANSDFVNLLPYITVVGGFHALGGKATYASTGANLWISAPAGQWGSYTPAIVTTDQVGTDRGYDQIAKRGLATRLDINPYGDYISTMNGTSSASAIMSGVAALLLEEEPNLTWRDVKHVLASTARPIHSNIRQVRVAIDDVPYVMQFPWLVNGAGYKFHNWYGFGAVHVDAAIEYLDTFTPGNLGEFVDSGWLTKDYIADIPDGNGGGVEIDLPISLEVEKDSGSTTDTEPSSNPLAITVKNDGEHNIESVILNVSLKHDNLSDVGITLTSPSGMHSVVNPIFNNHLPSATNEFDEFQFSSNAFYGESPVGTWTVQIVDVQAENVGEIDSVALQFYLGQHPQPASDSTE